MREVIGYDSEGKKIYKDHGVGRQKLAQNSGMTHSELNRSRSVAARVVEKLEHDPHSRQYLSKVKARQENKNFKTTGDKIWEGKL